MTDPQKLRSTWPPTLPTNLFSGMMKLQKALQMGKYLQQQMKLQIFDSLDPNCIADFLSAIRLGRDTNGRHKGDEFGM